jgi:hypothetical protein
MGKFVRLSLLGCSLLLLGSCVGTKKQISTDDNNRQAYVSPLGYTITAPLGFGHAGMDPSGQYYYFGYPDNDETGLSLIEMHEENPTSCSPELTGASKVSSLSDGKEKIEWGRVDFFEKYGGNGWIDYDGTRPLCAQPDSAVQRYTLCSEKGGKTIVVCIYQMKDDPELAKKIFETFRWTE